MHFTVLAPAVYLGLPVGGNRKEINFLSVNREEQETQLLFQTFKFMDGDQVLIKMNDRLEKAYPLKDHPVGSLRLSSKGKWSCAIHMQTCYSMEWHSITSII